MAGEYKGDFTTSNTIYVYFNTFDSNDPSASVAIAAFIVEDIEIYKDGSITQRSSDSGVALLDTDGIDFDGHVGIGGFSIDLSDDADSGFYAAGSEYMVMVGPTTIDSAVVNFVACTFSIERAGGALALIKTINIANGAVESDLTYIHGTALTETAGQLAAAFVKLLDVATPVLTSESINQGADNNTILSSLTIANGAVDCKLTYIMDNILTEGAGGRLAAAFIKLFDVSTPVLTAASINQGADNNVLAAGSTGFAAIDTVVDAIKVVTDVLPDSGALTSIGTDTARLTGVRAAVLTDWINGGRLDLLLDAITAAGPTNTQMEARTPTAAQLAYIVANANTGLPVTFTTAGGSTIAAVLNNVDGSSASATDDQYNGRLLVFTDGTLKGVVTDITDYTGSSTTCVITAIPTAPTSSHAARLI